MKNQVYPSPCVSCGFSGGEEDLHLFLVTSLVFLPLFIYWSPVCVLFDFSPSRVSAVLLTVRYRS